MQWVEQRIQEAIERGEFENLSGKGKPLRWDDNPFTPADMQLAYHLLRSQGFTLPWIETRWELMADIQQMRRQLAHLKAQSKGGKLEEKQRVVLGERIDELNRRIRNYNISVPLARFQLPILDRETELEGKR